MLNTAVCPCPSQTPWLSLPPSLPLGTIRLLQGIEQSSLCVQQVYTSMRATQNKMPKKLGTGCCEMTMGDKGLPWWFSWSRICLQCRRPGFDRWVGKMPWRREWLPTPVSWPGEFYGVYSPQGSQRVGHNWVTFSFIQYKWAIKVHLGMNPVSCGI